jgi:hypothetical protein
MINPLSDFKVDNLYEYKKVIYENKVIKQADIILNKIKEHSICFQEATYIDYITDYIRDKIYPENIELLKNNGFKIYNIKWIETKQIQQIISWNNKDFYIEFIKKKNNDKFDYIEL